MLNLTSEYSLWYILPCILLGALYAFVLYFRETQLVDVSIWVKRLLFGTRLVVVSLIAFLLLNPLLRTVFREVEKPVVIVGQDESESIGLGNDSSFYRTQYKESLNDFIAKISDKYEVQTYSFGDNIKQEISFNYASKETDITGFIDEINTRFANRNVGAVILASDGLYNKGINPLYAPFHLKAPLYTIALGDTSQKKDLILNKVNHNRLAYLGNKFPLEVIIDARKLNKAASKLIVSKGNQVLFSQDFKITNDNFSITIPLHLEAKEPGIHKYSLKLVAIEGESTKSNNSKDVFIDVLDSRQKILILAESPHPDVKAIKQSIEANENYEVSVVLASEFNKSVKDYNLVILHALPSLRNQVTKIIDELNRENISRLFVIGNQTSINHFNALKSGISINGFSNRYNESQAVFDQGFSLFTLNESNIRSLRKYPPLSVPFGNYKVDNGVYTLLKQKIGIVQSQEPLLLINAASEIRTGVIMGEGIWRWRLFDYYENSNHDNFNETFGKLIQFLSLKVDKSLFRTIGKNNYRENEPIEFDAEVYNESYELVNDNEVSITFINSENKKYPFVFNKTSNAYRLNAGILPAGSYRYEAQIKIGDKAHYEKGEFVVSPVEVENLNTVADHHLLHNLSHKHDGKMFGKDQLSELFQTLENREDIKPVSYSHQKLNELINLKLIFFLILALLSLEWFIRKRSGAY